MSLAHLSIGPEVSLFINENPWQEVGHTEDSNIKGGRGNMKKKKKETIRIAKS